MDQKYEFITTVVKSVNIFVYQFSLLYVQYNIYLDIDECQDEDEKSFMDVCFPEGYNEKSEI